MKWWWIAGAAVGVVVLGVVLGSLVDLSPASPNEPGEPDIREILLGSPASPPTADRPWQGSDRLTQRDQYTTTDRLALRVVSDESPERSIQLTVRLLQADGSHQPLQPTAITVSGGTGGYCCWQVATPGKYQLQILRGGAAPFVIPLTIVKAPQTGNSPIQAL